MPGPAHRRPESVLVVIHTADLQCLLLKRLRPTDFWQSVTGSLQWGETSAAAARREVREETGLAAHGLIDAKLSHRFKILPHYLDEYGPAVTENTEHVWYLRVPEAGPVQLDPAEHSAYCWLPQAQAVQRVSSWTNRAALERLGR